MGNAVEDIRTQILTVRQELRHNLDEVEERAKALVDWRHAYRSHSGLVLACAAIGGFLVAHHLASRRRGASEAAASRTVDYDVAEPVLGHIRTHVADIQTALVTVVAAHAKRLLGKWIPGFADNLPSD